MQYIAQSKQGPDRIYDLRREPRSTSRRPSAWLGLNGVHNDIFCGALTERQFARRECARIVNIDRAMVPASQGPGQASDKQLSLVKGTADHRNDIDGQRAGWKLPRPAGPQQQAGTRKRPTAPKRNGCSAPICHFEKWRIGTLRSQLTKTE